MRKHGYSLLPPDAPIGDRQRAVFAALADVLLPGNGSAPSASQAGVGGKWLDRTLDARADLLDDLLVLLARAERIDPRAFVLDLYATDASGFQTLAVVAAGAYYLNPKVRRAIGYPGQQRRPDLPDESDYYLDGGQLLTKVREAGPRYRPTPRSDGEQ